MTEAGTAREKCEGLKKDKQWVESAQEKITVESTHSTAESLKLTAEVGEWLEGLKERRDNLLKACSAGREYQARRQPLQGKIVNTEEMIIRVRAKVDKLVEELISLGDPEKAENDLDERDKQKVIPKSFEDNLVEFKSKRMEHQPRARTAHQLKEELKVQRHMLEILEAALSEMRRELAGLPEEDPTLLVELARVEMTIYKLIEKSSSRMEKISQERNPGSPFQLKRMFSS